MNAFMLEQRITDLDTNKLKGEFKIKYSSQNMEIKYVHESCNYPGIDIWIDSTNHITGVYALKP